VAGKALVDFLRNDKWNVADGTWRGVADKALVDFLRNCQSDLKSLASQIQ